MRLGGHYAIHAGHTNNKYYNTNGGRRVASPVLDNATHCYTRSPDDSFASLKKFYRRRGIRRSFAAGHGFVYSARLCLR